jgi:anti-sigma regulatory factor (Ser/Thr protein kinase)
MVYRYQTTIAGFDFPTVNREVADFCAHHHVPENKLYAVQLVIEELVTNIIKYGNGATIAIAIAIKIKIAGLKLVITDNSAPFNPLEATTPNTELTAAARDIGGLGLFLVGKMVKSLNYKRKGDCNVLTAEL